MTEEQFAHNLTKKVSGRQFGAKSLKIIQKSIVFFFRFCWDGRCVCQLVQYQIFYYEFAYS